MKIKFSWILSILLIWQSVIVTGTNYYVSSSSGNDSGDGKSIATAWKTLSKVNSHSFSPGDSVFLKRGDTWRESLVIPSSGTSGNYLYFGAYGTGSKPHIFGSVQAVSWSDQGGNVWKSSTVVSDPWSPEYSASDIFFEHTDGTVSWGAHKSGTSSLSSEYDWVCVSGNIYVYSATDPSTRYASVEIPQEDIGINVNTKQYITIDGLDIRYIRYRGVNGDEVVDGSGFTIQNCNICYVGERENTLSDSPSGYALAVIRNDLLIRNNDIHDAGRRIVSIHLYDYSGITFSNIIIEGNILHEGFHGSGFGIAMDDGRSNNTFKDIIIRNNIIYDSPSRNLTNDGFDPTTQGHIAAGESGATIANVQIYNNIWMYSTAYGLELYNVDNVTVYNNVFYSFNPNGSSLGYRNQLDISHGSTNIDIKNNIFYNPLSYDILHIQTAIFLENDQPVSEVTADYNLFYEADPRIHILAIGNTNYYESNWSAMKSAIGWQAHDPGFADPMFVSSTDLHVQEGSPAIGAGVQVPGVITDFEGNYYNNPPSIGAFEANPKMQPDTNHNQQVVIIYPNPTHDRLTVLRKGESLDPLKINILGISGQVIYEDILPEGVEKKDFTFSLTSGIYLVKIYTNGTTGSVQKLIVVKY